VKALALTVWLTALWVVLWRDPTAGNVVGGLLAAALVLVLFPARRPERRDHTVRPVRLAVFLGWFAWQLVLSNLVVAREVVTPRDRIRTGVVRVPLVHCSDLVVTVVANAITLTPGTLTLEARRDPTALYVHVLHQYDLEEVRAGILRLQRLVVRAIGSDRAVAALADPPPPDPAAAGRTTPTEASS
jgi:multicomponent Na+:H+ antiporter subunit E